MLKIIKRVSFFMFQQPSSGRIKQQIPAYPSTIAHTQSREVSLHSKPRRSSTECFYKTFDSSRWKEIAFKMKAESSTAARFQLEYFNKRDSLPLFTLFLNKLKDYNHKVSTSNPSRTEQELHEFIFNHLKSISRQPKPVQDDLLKKLLVWYQQSIKPKPQLVDYIRKLRRRQYGLRRKIQNEDESVRQDFKTNFILDLNDFYRKKIGNNTNGNQNEIRRVLNSISRNQDTRKTRLMNEGTVVRRGQRKEYNLKTWRDEGENDSRVRLFESRKARRRQENCKTVVGLERVGSQAISRFQNKIEDLEVEGGTKRQKSTKTYSIGGLTLLKYPFQNRK